MFLSFVIRDYQTKRVLFQVGEGLDEASEAKEFEGHAYQDVDDDSLDALRSIRYDFNVDVLRLPVISTQCVRVCCGGPLPSPIP